MRAFTRGLSSALRPPVLSCFIDFRGLADEYMRDKGIDYFENSRRATYVQRQYAIDNPHGWVGYDSLCWGITASDGPGDKYNFGTGVPGLCRQRHQRTGLQLL
jgi:hypothetical protein